METSKTYTTSFANYIASSPEEIKSNVDFGSNFLNKAYNTVGWLTVPLRAERLRLQRSPEFASAFRKLNNEIKDRYRHLHKSSGELLNNSNGIKSINYFAAGHRHAEEGFRALDSNINLVMSTVMAKLRNDKNNNPESKTQENENTVLLINAIIKEIAEFFKDQRQFEIASRKTALDLINQEEAEVRKDIDELDCFGCFNQFPLLDRILGGSQITTRDLERTYIHLQSTKEILEDGTEDLANMASSFDSLHDLVEELKTVKRNIQSGREDDSEISVQYPSNHLGSSNMNMIDKINAYTGHVMTNVRSLVNKRGKRYSNSAIIKNKNIVPSPTVMIACNIPTYKELHYNNTYHKAIINPGNKKWKLLQNAMEALVGEGIFNFRYYVIMEHYNHAVASPYHLKESIELA